MPKRGISCKVYRNTGSWGTPTWSEVKCISDWQQNVQWSEAEAPTRESAVTFTEKVMLSLSWTGKVQKGNVGDATNLAAILAAIPAQATVMDVMILDGSSATNGNTGYRCEVKVFSGNESQNPSDILYPEITLKPSVPSVAGQIPQSVLVSSGAPVLTDIAA